MLAPGVPASQFFRVLTTRPNYSQKFSGLELTATKRMSHRWTMRASASLEAGASPRVRVTPPRCASGHRTQLGDFRFANRIGVTVSGDLFNAPNKRTILQRETLVLQNANGGAGGSRSAGWRITELQAPRVWRLGAKFNF